MTKGKLNVLHPTSSDAEPSRASGASPSDEPDTASSASGTLATELRQQRKRKGMSLDDLASSSGVSRAMISKIERAQSSPSTSTLSKLADALETSLARLVGQETRQHDVVIIKREQQMSWTDATTGFSRRVLSPILPGRGLDLVMAEMPAKTSSGTLVAHAMPVEEYIYVLSGSLVVTIGETRTALNASDALYYRADAPHCFENEGRTPCKYILVVNRLSS